MDFSFHFRGLSRCVRPSTGSGTFTVYPGWEAHFSTKNKHNNLSLLLSTPGSAETVAADKLSGPFLQHTRALQW